LASRNIYFERKAFLFFLAHVYFNFSILERSKGLIYDDYYNRIKPALDGRCAAIFTDTDSLCLRVTANISMDEVLDRLEPLMDNSNYPKSHPRYNGTRKNQLKLWKDELCGNTLLEFVGLSSKTYAMRVGDANGDVTSSSKCKGVGRGFRKRIAFEEYKKCVTGVSEHTVTQYAIRSLNHEIRTVKIKKLCFSSFDNKRHIMNCNIHTVPYGSRYIEEAVKKKRCVFCPPPSK
jgi:hypothetical protein